MITIEEINPVFSRISDAEAVKDLLSFEREYWKQGPFRKEKKTYNVNLLDKSGYYYTGFNERITDYLKRQGIKYSLDVIGDHGSYEVKMKKAKLDGVNFSDYLQDKTLDIISSKDRGVFRAPTGAGKSVVIAGLISIFHESTSLVIVPTQGIFDQMIKDFSKWFEEDLGYIGKGKKVFGSVSIAIINSIANMDDKELEDFGYYWDLLIVDEVHKVTKLDGIYTRVLEKMQSVRRYGLTATLPVKPESKLLVEGLIGPNIGETKEEDLVKIGVLAKPKVKILKIPKNDKVRSLRKYGDVYEQGIVLNKRRHEIIVEAVKEEIKNKGTALVFVVKINHGVILKDYFSKVYGEENVKLVLGGPPQKLLEETKKMNKKLKTLFREVERSKNSAKYKSTYKMYSDFKDQIEVMDEAAKSYRNMSKEREQYRVDLDDKKYRVAIATTSWKEGINIPSLDVVVNATGYKSAIMNEQLFGRGRRATKKKKEVLLIDCFDASHPYLVDAFGERISMYCEKGWL